MIPAGGSGKITAKVKTTANQNGRLTKGIAVHTDVAGASDLQLSFSFQVVAPILVLPTRNLNLAGVEGEPTSASVVVHRTDGKPLQLSDPEDSLPMDVQLSTRPPNRSELEDQRLGAQPGDVVLEATVPSRPEAQREMGKVTVHTNHPDLPTLEIPLAVWIRPAITVRPSSLSLRLASVGGVQRPAALRLSSSRRQPFTITGVEVSRPELLGVAVDSKVPKLYHVLQVSLADGVDPGQVHETVQALLEVSTSDPAKPRMEIPVVVVPAPVLQPQAPSATRTPGP